MLNSPTQRRAILVVAVPGRIESVTRALIRTLQDVAVVKQVGSGAGAIAALEGECCDLVVWDATALCGEGWCALAEAKERWPAVRALALAEAPAEAAAARAAGADAVLRRHYRVDALLATVAGLLATEGSDPGRQTG